MTPFRKRLPTFIFWLEIFFWLVVAYLARLYFDRWIGTFSSAWLAWLLRLAFLALIVILAILIHGWVERFLKSRGIIE